MNLSAEEQAADLKKRLADAMKIKQANDKAAAQSAKLLKANKEKAAQAAKNAMAAKKARAAVALEKKKDASALAK